jgi:hypothetical protein
VTSRCSCLGNTISKRMLVVLDPLWRDSDPVPSAALQGRSWGQAQPPSRQVLEAASSGSANSRSGIFSPDVYSCGKIHLYFFIVDDNPYSICCY